jgi:hypothetical protein
MVIGPMGRYQIDFLEEYTAEALLAELCRDQAFGFKVFIRDRFRCVACGRRPVTHLNIEFHADHIVSVADGGKTTLENLQTLCQGSNLGKGRISIT